MSSFPRAAWTRAACRTTTLSSKCSRRTARRNRSWPRPCRYDGREMIMSDRRDTDVTRVHEWKEGRVEARQDDLAAGEPPGSRICGRPPPGTERPPGPAFQVGGGFFFLQGV